MITTHKLLTFIYAQDPVGVQGFITSCFNLIHLLTIAVR